MQTNNTKDYGADPMGNGKFKMIPSGEIVTREEREKRLEQYKRRHVKNDCLGMSWEQIEAKQGGKLYR
jgi:hypothetical protein